MSTKLIPPRRKQILFALAVVAITVAAVVALSLRQRASSDAITTAPHQALYRLSLSQLRHGNVIAGVTGQMSYRIEDACSGWNVAQKFTMRFSYPELPPVWMVSDYNTYESKDGNHFQFSTRRTRDGQLMDEVLGKADRPASGDMVLDYKRPREIRMSVPAEMLFPNQHTLKILEAAQAGETIAYLPLFDGSDTALGADVNSVISAAKKPYVIKVEDITPVTESPPAEEGAGAADEAQKDLPEDSKIKTTNDEKPKPNVTPITAEELNRHPLIDGTRAWKIRMAFFPRRDWTKGMEAESGKPANDETTGNESEKNLKSTTDANAAEQENEQENADYEMTIILHSNGVVSHFTLDYPDFSLDADLLSISDVARNNC